MPLAATIVRERGELGLGVTAESLWGRTELKPEMVCEELSFKELALLKGASRTEVEVSRDGVGENGECGSRKETAIVVAEAMGEDSSLCSSLFTLSG
uniref:Uncharacterized protein n=1 Tax=Cannabis sativa TaxID=3483 RepID=A0A803QAV2_CANSA